MRSEVAARSQCALVGEGSGGNAELKRKGSVNSYYCLVILSQGMPINVNPSQPSHLLLLLCAADMGIAEECSCFTRCWQGRDGRHALHYFNALQVSKVPVFARGFPRFANSGYNRRGFHFHLRFLHILHPWYFLCIVLT